MDVPRDIRTRLIAGFFISVVPLVSGALVNIAVNIVAVILHPTIAFMTLLGLDFCCVILRMAVLTWGHRAVRLGRPTPTNLLLLSSLCWSGIVGVGTAMCLASGDPVLQFLAPTTMMGITSGVAARNNGAPRFAVAQIVFCDLRMQFAVPFLAHPWMLLSVFQCPLFIVSMIAMVHRLNRNYVAVVLAERDSERRATHDSLTGTLNRDGLMMAFCEGLKSTTARCGAYAILYLDLDGFKDVNDSFGHPAGDELLRQAAHRFVAAMPAACRVGRFGGDEFIVLAPGCDARAASILGEAVISAIALPFEIKPGVAVRVGVSVGIACAIPDSTVDALLAAADAALYRAKTDGKGRCVLAADVDVADRRAA